MVPRVVKIPVGKMVRRQAHNDDYPVGAVIETPIPPPRIWPPARVAVPRGITKPVGIVVGIMLHNGGGGRCLGTIIIQIIAFGCFVGIPIFFLIRICRCAELRFRFGVVFQAFFP